MKTLLIAAAVAAVVASPALAQPRQHVYHADRSAAQAYAAQRGPVVRNVGRSTGNDVYVSGHYVGSDPDPQVRQMLANDPREGHW